MTLPFRPGPGLTVVAGRNGSGESTLAEGLELALTGTYSRWNDKAAVWSQNWRNLHAGDPAHIRVDIAEEGSAANDWTDGRDVNSTYECSEMGYEGSDVLAGVAPTSANPYSNEGARDPQSWVRLGHALIKWVYRTF